MQFVRQASSRFTQGFGLWVLSVGVSACVSIISLSQHPGWVPIFFFFFFFGGGGGGGGGEVWYLMFVCMITHHLFKLGSPNVDERLKSLLFWGTIPRLVGWFNIKMWFCHYRKFHCGDKMILGQSYFHNGISNTGKMTSLYWIRA